MGKTSTRKRTPRTDVEENYFTEWLGGPPLYSTEKGHPRLRARHLPFSIGESERDQWMLCMNKALDDVVTDPLLRNELGDAIYRLADFMRNRDE